MRQRHEATGAEWTNDKSMLLRTQHLECLRTLAEGITHSLNNVFAPILLATDLLRPKMLTPGDRDVLDSVEQSVRRGTELVRQILGFARAADGQRARIELRHLIRALSQLVRDTSSGDVTVTTAYPEDLWPVVAEAPRIFQALIGLCLRGREELADGGSIRIDAANMTVTEGDAGVAGREPGSYVCVTVAALRSASEIEDPTTSPGEWVDEQRQGLALAAANEVAEAHGGWLVASRWPDQGTVVRLGLPAVMAQPEDDSARPAWQGEVATGKVLIADQSEATLRLAERVLAEAGFRVQAVSEPEAAAELAGQDREVVVVLLEVGQSPTRAARVLEVLHRERPDLVVIVTDERPESDADSTDSALFESRLAKPYSAPQLLRAIASAFAGR